MKRILKTLFIASVLFSAVFAFSGSAKAASWDPGRIIDDGKFTNKNSMSAGDIQNFLNSKVPACDTWHSPGSGSQGEQPPWTCLKDYNEGGKSAAQIIWEQAQAYSINPQVLLVTLQKENGLITDTWPYRWQYRTAMGFGCPDGAPCDAQWFGFTNQVTQAARHFRNFYDQNPNWYIPYRPGVNFIRWSPNGACGGSNVNIVNRATAALYSYTPYQPNQAALNNLYGTGDGCSAYGNRNFWRDFNNWFGSTYDGPYQWEFITQTHSRDLNNLPRGEKATITLKVRNIGTSTWSNSGANPVRLITVNPPARSSGFATAGWIDSARAASLQENTVTQGQEGTFVFDVQANTQTGEYQERFSLVADNAAWFNDLGYYLGIKVVNSVISGQVTQNTLPTTMAAGSTVSGVVTIQNTGNVTWKNSGVYPAFLATYPTLRTSPFQHSTWPQYYWASTQNQATVAPGQTATFNVTLQAPQLNGAFTEQFQMAISNLGWSHQPINHTITVSGAVPQTGTKPIHRLYNPRSGDHFYTSTDAGKQAAMSGGYLYEGIEFYSSNTQTTVPVHRLYNPRSGDHFYTSTDAGKQAAMSGGYLYEGIEFYSSSTQTTVPVHRLYNPRSGDHFYTSTDAGKQAAMSGGYLYEGIEFYGLVNP